MNGLRERGIFVKDKNVGGEPMKIESLKQYINRLSEGQR
jgi:hypothetical protein